MNQLIIPTKAFDVVLFKVPYTVRDWNLTSLFFDSKRSNLKIILKNGSIENHIIPVGNYIFKMRFSHFLHETLEPNEITLATNDNKARICHRLRYAGYKIDNPFPKPNHKDRKYDDGTYRYVNDFYDWVEEQKKLDDFLIYFKHPLIPNKLETIVKI